MVGTMSDATAPEGCWYVCHACGKKSKTRHGITGERSPGWDASCMSNCELARPATAEEQARGFLWWAVPDDSDADANADAHSMDLPQGSYRYDKEPKP